MLPLLAIGAVVWFLIFAPERKARKKREEMLGALKKGDKVVTTGGLHGQIADVRENEVVIKCGEVRLTFSRSSVHQVEGEAEWRLRRARGARLVAAATRCAPALLLERWLLAGPPDGWSSRWRLTGEGVGRQVGEELAAAGSARAGWRRPRAEPPPPRRASSTSWPRG